jgi:Calcineurin-like phosphoesterase
MKKYLLVLTTIFCFSFGYSQNANVCDGPYVSYSGTEVIVRSINSSGTAVVDSFPENQKNNNGVNVYFSNHKDWDFTVLLRPKITNEPFTWKAPEKMLILSDIEGEFDNFRGLLVANHVMDSLYRWTFGKGHLVICGDLFDRGQDVSAELWLLYRLEDDARKEGGYVHTILGNHDIMNLSGDLRYVQQKYFDHAKMLGRDYSEFYNADSELGRWLRSKNIIEKVGDNLCLHGGISPEILKTGWAVEKINDSCRPYYDQGMHPENFRNKTLWNFFDGHNISPFWYRGYFLDPMATQGLIDSTLAFYQCKKIIVGHDIIDNVACFYQCKVLGVDVNEHEGNAQGLLIEKDKYYKIDLTGNKQILGSR